MRTLTWEARHDVLPPTRDLLECWFGYPLVVVRLTDKAGGGDRGKVASEGIQSSDTSHEGSKLKLYFFAWLTLLKALLCPLPFSGWLFQIRTMSLGSRARMGLQTELSVMLIPAFSNNAVSKDGNWNIVDVGGVENNYIDNCPDDH
ncbi:hypothetical protein TIFTF001_027359 [Ficus carica]|uniref:Uncharacterized protein n=1 Tax=Ficus carica TaxID=3494 RepID=A0AA88DMX5_FICCA|nr:hypothetical protein TIFTF001_027359 [Ficus carica]